MSIMDDFLAQLEVGSESDNQQNGDLDPSFAFFDHDLLETLFYNEMMADSSFPSAAEGCSKSDHSLSSAEGFMGDININQEYLTEKPQSASVYSAMPVQHDSISGTNGHEGISQTSAMAVSGQMMQLPVPQFSADLSTQTQHTQISPFMLPGGSVSNNAHMASSGTGIAQHVYFNSSAPAPVDTVRAGTTMDEMQIASLQAEYRAGMAAAAVLSQRQQQATAAARGITEQQYIVAGPGSQVHRPTLLATGASNPTIISNAHPPVQQTSTAFTSQSRSTFQQTAPFVSNQQGVAHSLPTTQQNSNARSTPQVWTGALATSAQPVNSAANLNDRKAAEARQLVSQFASLAEKLGISLPQNVLSSLTTAAVLHGEKQQTCHQSPSSSVALHAGITAGTSQQGLSTSSQHTFPARTQRPINAPDPAYLSSNAVQNIPIKSTARKIEDTAAAAVQAVVEGRRSFVTDNKSSPGAADEKTKKIVDIEPPTSQNAEDKTGQSLEAGETTSNTGTAQRKRKRPRNDECEIKLSALKDENRILKRNLDTLLKKTQTIDLERAQAERAMRDMVQQGNPDEEKLQQLVKRFTEMYSDYGRSRQQELRFHLAQLRK